MVTKIEAMKRLVESAPVRVKAEQDGSTYHLNYASDYKKKWKRALSDGGSLKTVAAGTVTTSIGGEEVTAKMQEKYGDDLLEKAPSIEVTIGGKEVLLTWNECFNLAEMLIQTAGVAYFG